MRVLRFKDSSSWLAHIKQGGESMAGKIKKMIDSIIEQRAKDNAMLAGVIKTKLMLKGIDPSKFSAQSDDDPAIIGKLEALMKDLK
jgi:hypothetical protein